MDSKVAKELKEGRTLNRDDTAMAIITILAYRLGEIRIGQAEMEEFMSGDYGIIMDRDIFRSEMVIRPRNPDNELLRKQQQKAVVQGMRPDITVEELPRSGDLPSRYAAVASEMENEEDNND